MPVARALEGVVAGVRSKKTLHHQAAALLAGESPRCSQTMALPATVCCYSPTSMHPAASGEGATRICREQWAVCCLKRHSRRPLPPRLMERAMTTVKTRWDRLGEGADHRARARK